MSFHIVDTGFEEKEGDSYFNRAEAEVRKQHVGDIASFPDFELMYSVHRFGQKENRDIRHESGVASEKGKEKGTR